MKTFRFLLIAVICILAGGHGIALGQCVPPPSGMVAWWPLDEASGPTAFDFAGIHQDNGIHMNTPTPTPGKVDSALCFNGIDQYVEVADDSEIDFDTLDFSIDGWIRTTDSVGTKVILDKREDTPAFRGYELYLYNGKLGLQLADGTYTNWTSTAFVADGTWRHFAVTVDRDDTSGIVFYRDGAYISAFDPTSHPGSLDNSSVLRMACRSFSLASFFNGCLDEIDLFNRVLIQTEIQAIYNADSLGKCKLTPLPDHYKTWRIQPLPFGDTVFVHDQFMQYSICISLDRIDFLSNPVNKVAQNHVYYISKPNNHLTWYRAHSFAPLNTFRVEYVNQIESTSVWIDTLKYLLVPTQKFPHAQPENLDHYIGYRIETIHVVEEGQLQLQDQFDLIPESIDWLVATYFLTPARKNSEPVYDTITHYVAYEIFPKQYPFQPIWWIHNQFGYDSLEVLESKFLLVPTKKIAVHPQPDTLRNHYKTWTVRSKYVLETPFVKDQFMSDSLKLDALNFLSNPVKKVVQNDTFNIIGDTTDHLTWYRAQGRDTLLKITYVNQFESTSVIIDSVKYLLVPAQKSPHRPHHDLDHYKAYNIKNPQSLIRHVQLQDQFDSIPENIDTLKPVYFLTPAQKNNEPVYDTITHYVAYFIKPQRVTTLTRTITDQFMSKSMVIDTSKILLVPTRKLKVELLPDTLLNHFKTWRINTPHFDTVLYSNFVTVQDQFMDAVVRLDSIDFLSNPAKKIFLNDTSNITRPNDHLTWYRAKSFAPTKRFKVQYVNQFESTSALINTLKYLLVPTRKFPHDPPENLDHYIGYKIEMARLGDCQFQLQDQFDSIPEFIYGFLATYFFTPARKNNEPVYDTITHYVAYEFFPKRTVSIPVNTQDQFGSHSLEVLESKFLLVPTKKISFKECGGGDVNADSMLSVSDVIYLFFYLFKGGPSPIPELLVGDVNGDGKVTVSDVVYLINYLFKGGPPPSC